MRRKTIALLLALTMCLFLLSACGADSRPDGEPSTAGNTSAPTEQQPDEKEEQPSQQPEKTEEPTQKPEESEEPTQQEPEEHEGTKLLALLKEEWNNGFFEGNGPKHSFFINTSIRKNAFIYDDVIYIRDARNDGNGASFGGGALAYGTYDITSKKWDESLSLEAGHDMNLVNSEPIYFLDGIFYHLPCRFKGENSPMLRMYDLSGAVLNSFQGAERGIYFDKGILPCDTRSISQTVLSYELEKIADVPLPQRDIEHGLKEDVYLDPEVVFAADGTVYGTDLDNGNLYRINTDTWEWECVSDTSSTYDRPFLGKYVSDFYNGIYDRVTGEQVFEYGELYPAVDEQLCYFGGDQYLGKKGSEYRWVNLTDLTMSDPLPFPENTIALTVLNDTYCVYRDDYGWFLWNYNTGEEETIMMFEN